jgi:hypothetical protein
LGTITRRLQNTPEIPLCCGTVQLRFKTEQSDHLGPAILKPADQFVSKADETASRS